MRQDRAFVDQGRIYDAELIIWLNAAVDWAEKNDILYEVVRCKFDGWLINLRLKDAVGEYFHAMGPRSRRQKSKAGPAETIEDFPENVRAECSLALMRRRQQRQRQLVRRDHLPVGKAA